MFHRFRHYTRTQFILLGIVIVVAISFFAIKFLQKIGVLRAATSQASLLLPTADSLGTLYTDRTDPIVVPITLNTNVQNLGTGTIRGVDVKMTFDNTIVRLSRVNPVAISSTTLKTFAPVKTDYTFDEQKVIDNANTTGTIDFSGITYIITNQATNGGVTNPYSGSTVLTNLEFMPVTQGSTTLSFNFTPDNKLDSNVISDDSTPVDTLTTVNSLTLTIQSPSPNPTSGVTVVPSLTPIPTNTPVPVNSPTPTTRPSATPVIPSPTPIPTRTPTPYPTASGPTSTPFPTPTGVLVTVTQLPVADTYVKQSYPSSNFGKSSSIYTQGGSSVRIAYFKFDLSKLAGKTISSVRLKLRAAANTKAVQSYHLTSSSTWSETGLTYANRPTLGSVITTVNGAVSGSYLDVNLTNGMTGQAGKIITIAIDASTSDDLKFYSKEYTSNTSYRPQLTVQYR